MTKNHISSDNEDAKQFSKSHAKQTTDENHIISKRATDSFEENLYDYLTDPGPVPTNVIEEEENQLAARDIQAELLRWHHRLGHLSFQKLKLLELLRVIPSNLATAHPPKCAGCIYGALTKRPWRTKSLKESSKLFTATKPGECVSVDQLESTTPGFIAQFKGVLTKDQYRASTVFVDHFSRFIYIHLQRGLTSAETVQAKRAFEAFAQAHGATIKHYHCDNSRFADNAYLEHVTKSGQTISYCGVNAHFQNGIAEKRIRDLQERTRKKLLHAKARWPSAIELNLWPYALQNANHLLATLLDREDGSCPLERFSKSDVSPQLKSNHTFGCPVYDLQDSLQAGGHLPKWNSRARLGIYLGPSPRYASSVSLVLSLSTGLVSPQFHVKHDNFFETVQPLSVNPTTPSNWQILEGFQAAIKRKPNQRHEGEFTVSEGASESQQSEINVETAIPEVQMFPEITHEHFEDGNNQISTGHQNQDNLSRYGRIRRPTQRMQESLSQRQQGGVAYSTYYEALHEDDYLLQDQMSDPIAFLAAQTNSDTMYFDQAMQQEDREHFIQAIIDEVNAHIEAKHWELIPRSQVPVDTDILPAVWSMKRKLDIKTRRVYKWKACLNVHGGKQKFGINYFENYAPVVTGTSIWIVLILSIINKWHT